MWEHHFIMSFVLGQDILGDTYILMNNTAKSMGKRTKLSEQPL